MERDPLSLFTYVAFFHFKVLCHERRQKADRYSGGKEYSWVIKRRFSDFQALDAGLREVAALPSDLTLPRMTLWRHIYPSESFVQEREQELFKYFSGALQAASEKAAADPDRCTDAADVCHALPSFLGLQKDANADPRKWALPDGAEERQASLVHSLDRGVFVSGHLDAGVQLTKHDRQAFLGDLTCTHAETRHTSKAAPAKAQPLRRFDPGPKSVESPTSSPPSFSNSSWSEVSSPLLSPLPSPAESRAPSPRKRLLSGDDATSSASFSTADTICKVEVELVEEPSAPVLGWAKVSSPCAWMEVDLDNELARAKDHNNWWAKLSGEFRQATSCVRAERRRTLERYEAVAAMWRELSVDNEVLHTILGYGTERATMVIVHQTAPTFHGLRHFTFSKDRCHLLLAQGSKAIAYLHENGVTHGHLCPESFLMDETSLEPRVRLAWTPGQRRNEGHGPATFGFKGPGEDATPPSDIWSFGCVVLVWFANFKPAPHPWFQFAKSHRLKEAIQTALAQNPPELPKAYFDLHLAASEAEEGDTHLALAVQMCTRCLEHDPLERASADDLVLEASSAGQECR